MATFTVKQKNAKTRKAAAGKVTDLSEHPFFVKKAQEAEDFIKEHGLPFTTEKWAHLSYQLKKPEITRLFYFSEKRLDFATLTMK